MKDDQMILVAAVGFAAFLVAQKKGWFKNGALASGVFPSFQGGLFAPEGADLGYRRSDPGAYVTTEDLIAGASDNDWGYTPTRFEQTVDDVLSPDPMAGFWQPGYYRVTK